MNKTNNPETADMLRFLKTLRLFNIIGIFGSLILIYLTWNENISPVMWGGCFFLSIWMAYKTQKYINDVKARARIAYLINILLQEMKDEGVSDLRDLKRNKNKQ